MPGLTASSQAMQLQHAHLLLLRACHHIKMLPQRPNPASLCLARSRSSCVGMAACPSPQTRRRRKRAVRCCSGDSDTSSFDTSSYDTSSDDTSTAYSSSPDHTSSDCDTSPSTEVNHPCCLSSTLPYASCAGPDWPPLPHRWRPTTARAWRRPLTAAAACMHRQMPSRLSQVR